MRRTFEHVLYLCVCLSAWISVFPCRDVPLHARLFERVRDPGSFHPYVQQQRSGPDSVYISFLPDLSVRADCLPLCCTET